MLKTIKARLQQKYRTIPFPASNDVLPARFLGRPEIPADLRPEVSQQCRSVCPTGAIQEINNQMALDMGKCVFCGQCRNPGCGPAVSFQRLYRLASRGRDALMVIGRRDQDGSPRPKLGKNIFGRSLKLRQVSAGGCNACELDINVLNTLAFDLGRFGIQFVASPRHADGIVVTGPVTRNMRLALLKTYDAIPTPRLVIAVGACAISGGIYQNHQEVLNGVDNILPVDLFIPGCPPHPLTILDGLVQLTNFYKT